MGYMGSLYYIMPKAIFYVKGDYSSNVILPVLDSRPGPLAYLKLGYSCGVVWAQKVGA